MFIGFGTKMASKRRRRRYYFGILFRYSIECLGRLPGSFWLRFWFLPGYISLFWVPFGLHFGIENLPFRILNIHDIPLFCRHALLWVRFESYSCAVGSAMFLPGHSKYVYCFGFDCNVMRSGLHNVFIHIYIYI